MKVFVDILNAIFGVASIAGVLIFAYALISFFNGRFLWI